MSADGEYNGLALCLWIAELILMAIAVGCIIVFVLLALGR